MNHAPRWMVAALVLCAPAAFAQSNQNPALDVRLSNMREITVFGREGVFPDGVNGVAIETTVCNEGTVEVPWFEPMNPDHPMIAFLMAAVRDGRIVQISDRSFVKHGFFAANGNGCQTTCVRPGGTLGTFLGLGCSDTYASANNGDNYYLGHPDEIDPWLGTWNRLCSVFDRGIPDVGAPANCDGRRSLTHAMGSALGPVGNRVHLRDADLLAGGELYFQGHYVVEGLPDAGRDDALSSRGFSATWLGTRWGMATSGGLLPGSVLQRWPGATLDSATNGGDDGRVFVAHKVTGPVDGFYHYEFALHNRDSARGVAALRIPKCVGARVRNVGFRDIDQDPLNDWSVRVVPGAILFETGSAPLRWNTIHNFWFDSDAAPGSAALQLAAFDPGPGLPEYALLARAPVELANVHLGPGCALGTPPTLFAEGTPARAELGNLTFTLGSAGNRPLQPNLLFLSQAAGSASFQGCTLWIGPSPRATHLVSTVLSDAGGRALHAAPIPNDLALEGQSFRVQAAGRAPGQGPLFSNFELSEGLLVRVGNAIPGCP